MRMKNDETFALKQPKMVCFLLICKRIELKSHYKHDSLYGFITNTLSCLHISWRNYGTFDQQVPTETYKGQHLCYNNIDSSGESIWQYISSNGLRRTYRSIISFQ